MTSITESDGSTKVERLNPTIKGIGRYEFGWSDKNDVGANATRGLNEDVVRNISSLRPRFALAPTSFLSDQPNS